jgi:hypothetical protein
LDDLDKKQKQKTHKPQDIPPAEYQTTRQNTKTQEICTNLWKTQDKG